MPGPRDADDILRDGTTDLTATANLTHTLSKGIHHTNPLAVVVLVPQASAGDSLKVTAKYTDTGKKIEVTHTDSIDDNTTYPFLLRLPLPFSAALALAVDLTITDDGSPDFGAVQVWLERAEDAKVDA
jgi:hypothetical protein